MKNPCCWGVNARERFRWTTLVSQISVICQEILSTKLMEIFLVYVYQRHEFTTPRSIAQLVDWVDIPRFNTWCLGIESLVGVANSACADSWCVLTKQKKKKKGMSLRLCNLHYSWSMCIDGFVIFFTSVAMYIEFLRFLSLNKWSQDDLYLIGIGILDLVFVSKRCRELFQLDLLEFSMSLVSSMSFCQICMWLKFSNNLDDWSIFYFI